MFGCLRTMSFSVNDPDFKAGITSLAMMLQIPPFDDHLEQLKVNKQFDKVLSNKCSCCFMTSVVAHIQKCT